MDLNAIREALDSNEAAMVNECYRLLKMAGASFERLYPPPVGCAWNIGDAGVTVKPMPDLRAVLDEAL